MRVVVLLAVLLLSGCSGAPPASTGNDQTLVEGAPQSAVEPSLQGQPSGDAPQPAPATTSAGGKDVPPVPSPGNESAWTTPNPEPHVIVAVPDTGFNPYHVAFYRPERTSHPCTYIEAYPCSIPALNLTIGTGLSYDEAVAADQALWDAVKPGDVYWIPRTAFIAAACGEVYTDTDPQAESLGHLPGTTCILDDSMNHGTSTTAAVLRENPDALLAVVEGRPNNLDVLIAAGIPFDLLSISWGATIPDAPVHGTGPYAGYCNQYSLQFSAIPIFVGAGNDPSPSFMHCLPGHPNVISVTGGSVDPNATFMDSSSTSDFTASYFQFLPAWLTVDGEESHGGTSFSAPMAAGAASLTILEVRRASGYTGGLNVTTGILDAESSLTVTDLRHALNVSASYTPAKPSNQGSNPNVMLLTAPINPVAPWTSWGWGWLDAAAGRTAAICILDDVCETVDPMAQAYMDAQMTIRTAYYER